MSIEINGYCTDHLTPFERNKCARGLDYVGYIPVVGSVSGVARLIAGIASMIFFSIKASKANGEDKEKLLMYRAVAGHEALRGLLEITWIGIVFQAALSEVDSNWEFFPKKINTDHLCDDRTYKLKESQKDNEPRAGIIALPSCIAHGKYIYKDNSERSEDHIHYSNINYDNHQVIWKTLVRENAFIRGATVYHPRLLGTCGIVLKPGYIAKETDPATFTATKNN